MTMSLLMEGKAGLNRNGFRDHIGSNITSFVHSIEVLEAVDRVLLTVHTKHTLETHGTFALCRPFNIHMQNGSLQTIHGLIEM